MTITNANFQRSLKQSQAYLHFEDGTLFKGFLNRPTSDESFQNGFWGEAAFTTGMSGYQETITDPSFLGQHIVFSTAHIGNYQADERAMQSSQTFASAVIGRNFSHNKFFENLEIPLFSGTDTRALVKFLTTSSCAHKSVITSSKTSPTKEEFNNNQLVCSKLERVSQTEPIWHTKGEAPIVVINYGIKNAILKNLQSLNYPLLTLPFNSKLEDIIKYNPKMVFLSNGPGDPREYTEEIKVVQELLEENIPLRGICLGHQLLSIALGAKVIKLPFGQRGSNHPVIDQVSGDILITSQNHGYATHEASFLDIAKENCSKRELIINYKSLFDLSIEGLSSVDHFIKSVQFHPEANPGPSDASIFFNEIKDYLEGKEENLINPKNLFAPLDLKNKITKEIPYKKVLLVGSGPIKIGQASEFDYSGTQACKALKELGVDVVLLNSNPATIMTDADMSFRTYIEPITKNTIKKIIKKENVDAIISTMGGQTALNICVDLEEENFFKENDVTLLGANVDTIRKTEDRDLFAKELAGLGFQTGKRFSAGSAAKGIELANSQVGYPLIIRRDFALGGKGAALVHNVSELEGLFNETDIKFPITLEKSLLGYKEVELEVMVDKEKNGVVICSIENVDPCGIHTGDSITVAPAQTISDRAYQQLRTISLTVAKHMGIVAGGANVQFAINPQDEDDIIVIEMNPRVSRSSALASKATGYPIAKISAMLAVGYTLKEVLNDITKVSPVAFEPTLDYVAIKIPIFPFNKFPSSSKKLGPQMRSVGEVLALGGNFNEAFLKALRSLEMGLEIPSLTQLKTGPLKVTTDYIEKRLKTSSELSLLSCLEGLRVGFSIDKVNKLTKITPWFIEQVSQISEAENEIKNDNDIFKSNERFINYKKLGFSDKYLALLINKSQKDVLQFRTDNKISPIYKAVDTCSGEFPALTPYFYSTYDYTNEAIPLSHEHRSIVILGSGPNRIGQGIEFDYSCVKSCRHLSSKGIKSIMINSNPETVSTDYDSSDRLYISPLYSEDLFDILCHENPEGIITSFSGQTGIQIRSHIEDSFRNKFATFNFLGSSLDTLDLTEDRKRFSEITREVDLKHTKSMVVTGYKNVLNAMIEIGLPVIIRPSYVIGGESMYVFHSHDDIEYLPTELREQLKKSASAFQVETYLENAIEYDVDLIRDNKGNTIFTICEHIEHAGVHSGDSGMISPPVILSEPLLQRMKDISKSLAEKLNIIGPVNIQYAVKDDDIYCIEANPRGSRTLPFLSKAFNIALPYLATDAMLGEEIESWSQEESNFFCVKQSTFPFDRFVQDNIILGPKMRSTGETMGLDTNKEQAILKSYLGNYPKIDHVGKILISMADNTKEVLLPFLGQLHSMGYQFYATSGTYHYIKGQGVPCSLVAKINEEGISILEILKDENIQMVFNTPMNKRDSKSDGENIRNTAIQYAVPCFTRKENIQAVIESLIGTNQKDSTPISLQEAYQC